MQENNPYASPQSSLDTPSQPAGDWIPGSGSFDLGRTLSEGWNITIENLVPMLGVTILGGALMGVAYITCIGIFLLLPILMWGGVRFFLNTYDGKGDFGDLFSGFQNYGQVLGRSLPLLLILLLLSLVGSVPQYAGMFLESEAIILIGAVFSLAWSLLVMIRLYWSLFFLVDQDMAAVDSLKASWEATSGNWLNLILLMLLTVLVSIAGFLALVVGIFVAMPMTYVMYVSAYRQAVGGPARAA